MVADLVTRRRGRALGAVVACAVVCTALAACGRGGDADAAASDAGAQMAGVVREPPLDVGAVTLPDVAAGGAPFALKAERGGLLLLYFGYTNCPDVCPTTLSDVKRIRRDLGADAARIGVAMATVDPARDTAAVLTSYLGHFFDDAHALRTDDLAQLAQATGALGLTVTTRPTSDPGFYTVDHTATLYAVDPDGRVVVEWPFGTSAQAIESDVRRLLEQEAR